MTAEPITVVTSRPLPDSFPQDEFHGRCRFIDGGDDLPQAVPEATVLYSWQVPDNVPAETPHLRWIELPSAGVNHLIGHPVWASDIPIVSSTGIHAVPMAEHFFSMLLALTRQIPTIVRNQDRREWDHDLATDHPIHELHGSTLAIIGWGKIGNHVARIAHAFGMRVVGTRRSVHDAEEINLGGLPDAVDNATCAPDMIYPPDRTHDVLSMADVVLLLLPLTPDTRGSFGWEEFSAMQPGSLFFNIGRGGVVVEDDLIDALRRGHVGGAGLDVFVEEPLSPSSELWSTPNVIVSPHVGGNGPMTDRRAADLLARNLAAFLEGSPLLNVVDRDRGY